jgi:outer membrane protein insertion porin family
MKKTCAALLLTGFLAGQAWAFEAFVVEDIRVEGVQRISAGTVFDYLPVSVGDIFDEQRSAEAIRALFRTGFFSDVRLERDNGVLVVSLVERPAVAAIEITGNVDIRTEQLLEALRQVGLAEGRVFDRALLDKMEQELQRQYFARGKYAVRIDTTVTPLERNRVGIAIDISEGRVARIRQINIVGNEVFSERELLRQFQLSPTTWHSFYTRTDQYSRERLAADLEALRSFYLDRGHINFNIDSTQVSITPEKRDIYITVNVSEGHEYRVREVRLAGDLVAPEEDLFELVAIRQGDIFSRRASTETANEIAERLGNDGYAFANVNTIPEIDEEAREVTLTFFIDPGRRVYVRRINFTGNIRTQDEVLRREMRQVEGGWISTAAVSRSRTRLERLGYFGEVGVETRPVPGMADQVDLDFSVVERASGNLMAGVGYSQTQGILFNASVTQDNFLGTGRRVSAAFNNSRVNTIYSFSYTNPYYTLDGVSRGFSAFYRETDAEQANVSRYATDTFGGNVHFGIPVTEFNTVRLGFGYQNTTLKTTVLSPLEVENFIARHGDQFDTFTLTGSFAHDTRNRAVFANRGLLSQISAEVGVPGGDLEYYKLTYRQQLFIPLTQTFTLMLNGEVGYGDGYGRTGELPFFEHFYAGGARSVRGYRDNTLGPRDTPADPAVAPRPLGGALKTLANIELIFPPPFQMDDSTVRFSAFVDAGNVYASASEFDAGELRYSAGVAVTWLSPIGALTFSLAQPFNDRPEDERQTFQFSIGVGF